MESIVTSQPATVHKVNLLARDLRSIRHDLSRIIFYETDHVVNTASLKDAVDMLDGALIVMEGLDNE